MRRRLLRGVAGLLALVGSSFALEPAGASASASIDDAGWWWRLQANPALPLPPPPTVASRELLVQGAPDGATAMAAIAATLVAGEANPILTLEVVEGGDSGGDQAVLLACQAGSQWTGGDAKPWSEKPQPACESGVAGERSEDGLTWTFDLSALQFGDKVNVVLVPGKVDGQPEGANGSTFSLTFAAPRVDSIQTTPGAPPLAPEPTFDSDTFGGVDLGTDTTSEPFVAPDLGSGGGSLSLPPIEAALPEAEQGMTPVAPSVQDRTPLLPASAIDPRSPHARAVGVLLLLLGGAAAYLAGREQPVVGPEGVPGGLGRWSRPRWGTPPALRG